MFVVTAALSLTPFGSMATAEGASRWLHVGPVVSGDVQAFIDYQMRSSVPAGDGGFSDGPLSFQDEAAPLWINIHRDDLKASDHVFVQLVSYVRDCYRGDCSTSQVLDQKDLNFAEAGRFTGELAPLTLSYELNDGYALTSKAQYAAELVIWINGALYKGADGRNLQLEMPQ